MERRIIDLMDQLLVPTAEHIWTGRKTDSKSKIYWYQNVIRISRLESIQTGDYVIIGYECDEGIARNQGRTGASKGPEMIRRMLGKIAWHHTGARVVDIGNVVVKNGHMEESQVLLGSIVNFILKKNALPICLGGGHDIAYGTGMGFLDFVKNSNKKLGGIINFDAHFDLRKDEVEANSGTPFYELYQRCLADGLLFNYLILGLQKASNTTDLFETASDLKVKFTLDEEMKEGNHKETLLKIQPFLDSIQDIYITVDMDVFSGAYAPGVSALNPVGISPKCFFNIFFDVLNTKKVKILEIAETNPEYDRDHLTSRLAARIIDEFVSNTRF